MERLEDRTLFNTVITDTDPLTATPPTATFEYKDLKGQNVRVVVHGDVSAEFVFARVTKGGDKSPVGWNDVILGEPVAAGSKEDGRDLFHVYVAQASIDSYISIAAVPEVTAKQRPMQPYSGNVTLTIQPNSGNELSKSTAGGTGNIVLGTRTRAVPNIDNSGDIPIRVDTFNGQGIFPITPNHKLVAGLTTAPGVSLGKFMFGGAVMGEVRIDGSIETFYCGALLTGTTEGQTEGAALDTGNFHVGGDIRNILVKGAIGTHDLANDIDGKRLPTYFTGTDFDIGGRVGQIRTGGDYLATGIVHNHNAGLGLRTRQQELEFRIDPGINRGDFTDFQNGQFGDNEAFFFNDGFNNAQFLGSINSKTLGNNVIQLNGLYQRSSPRVNDLGDFYAVPLMAGQTISVRLIAPEVFTAGTTAEIKSILHAGIFDPDQRLIASDYSNVTDITNVGAAALDGTTAVDTDPAQQELFSITADKPGIYYIAVGETAPTFLATPLIGIEQPYQLQVTGVGNLGLGGLVASDTIYAPPNGAFGVIGGIGGITNKSIRNISGSLANIDVEHGDLGAVTSINDFILSNFDGFNAEADGGDLRAVDAISLGVGLGAQANNTIGFSSPALIGSLTGSVGMIRSKGTDEGADITYINAFGRGGSQVVPSLIGGDIQWISSPTFLLTDLECNGSIGVVQARDFGNSLYAGSLSANVDGKGKPGTIDLIDVTGDLGSLQAGGPVISTNTGGNVRYIHIGDNSTAFRPFLFGGSQPEQTQYAQGQSADITDDSGTLVHIRPTIEVVTDPVTGLPVTDINGNPTINSGTLTILTYPIARSFTDRGGGGEAIVRIDCTRGVQVSSSGTSVEIGSIRSAHFTDQNTGFLGGVSDPGRALVVDSLGPDGIANTGDENLGPDGIAGTADDPFVLDPTSTNTLSIDIRGARTDVFDLLGTNMNFVRNRTSGEIVNTDLGTVALLDAQSLGVAYSSFRSGMVLEGSTVADNPGTSETEGALFPFLNAKNAISINGGSEISPAVLTLQSRGAIGNVMILGRAQSITANADNTGIKGVFEGIVGNIYAKGQLRLVNIGEGLLPSGTGNLSRAGIYANGVAIGTADNGVGNIDQVVNQGLNSDIRGDIVAGNKIGKIVLHDGSIINADIESIIATAVAGAQTTTHTGTGSDLAASLEFGALHVVSVTGAVDQIAVVGKGGIIGTLVSTADIGNVVSTGGFGIINSEFTVLGAGRFQNFIADGYGIRGVEWFGGQSLGSIVVNGDGKRLNTSKFEPAVLLSGSQKVDPFFGTKPNALTDLYVVTGTTPQAPSRKGVSASGSFDLSEVRVSRDVAAIRANTIRATNLSIGNNIGTIATNDYVDSLHVTAGRIQSLVIGKDALRTDVSVSGPIANVNVGGSFKGTSRIAAGGPNGSITNVTIARNLYGNISAEKNITFIQVGSSYGSQGTHTGGDLVRFVVDGDFLSGAVLDVNKTLQNLTINGDFQDGAIVKYGALGTTKIIGADQGDLIQG